MPMIQTDSQHYSDIADAIRDMTDSQTEYYPSEMAAGIRSIPLYAQHEMYVGCQLLYTSINTSSSTAQAFHCFDSDGQGHLLSGQIVCPVTIPTGYTLKYRISAILNSSNENNAEIYINSQKILSASTWASTYGTFITHYGSHCMSDLFSFEDIATETRYIGTYTPQAWNLKLASSVNGQYAYAEHIILHMYLVKSS